MLEDYFQLDKAVQCFGDRGRCGNSCPLQKGGREGGFATQPSLQHSTLAGIRDRFINEGCFPDASLPVDHHVLTGLDVAGELVLFFGARAKIIAIHDLSIFKRIRIVPFGLMPFGLTLFGLKKTSTTQPRRKSISVEKLNRVERPAADSKGWKQTFQPLESFILSILLYQIFRPQYDAQSG